jgi:hypothetical protein
VPLRQSITYANVAISLVDEQGQSYIYGYVPIVVAKCGVFLKEKATGIEGIFRLSGSEKRIKELKTAFDSPDRYGKGLVWDGYTVHDAANVLRRYLNDLPEPVVPLDLYEKFREPLRGATKQAVGDTDGPQFVEHFDEETAIERYQKLITELPPLNRQLLLYLLDLLAVFAAKADENRMNSQNLAAIFQPGMLSHPSHDMSPEEYRLNQCVIIFLIENQDHFLIGMQGTGTDEKTKLEIESGAAAATATATATITMPATPASNRTSGIGRSSSNASAGAHSVRRDGQIRRNRSVTSRHSKGNESTTPNSPSLSSTPTNGGLGRSNTVPSKKSPAVAGGKFKRSEQIANSQAPALLEPLTQATPDTPRLSEQSNLAPPMGVTVNPASIAGRSQEKLLGVPQEQVSTPQKERNLQSLFQRSPIDESKRAPNKLKKKRIPGSLNHSAQSSNTSLAQPGGATSPPNDAPTSNPMDQVVVPEHETYPPPANQPDHESSSQARPQVPPASTDNHLHPESDPLQTSKSPPHSVHSGYHDGSDLEHGGESYATGSESAEIEKRSRWKMSKQRDDNNGASSSPSVVPGDVLNRSQEHADTSTASLGTSTGSVTQRPRKSFTEERTDSWGPTGSDQPSSLENGKESRDGKEETKGPIGWIRNKMREAKENAEQRRAKSPPGNHGHGHGLVTRGKSLDIRREQTDKPAQRPGDKPAEKPVSQPVKESTAKVSDVVNEKPIEGSSNVVEVKPVETEPAETKPVESQAQKSAVQPVEPSIPEVPEAASSVPVPELPKQQ